MKMWDLHVANIDRDRVQVQSQGPASACSNFETDFLICRLCECTFKSQFDGGGAGRDALVG